MAASKDTGMLQVGCCYCTGQYVHVQDVGSQSDALHCAV